MERKTKIEIALALAVIMLFAAFLLFWRQKAATPTTTTPTSTTGITSSKDKLTTSTGSTDTTTTPAPVVVKETSATTVARTFVERLGSYSSESDAANIEDILPMATASFQKQLETLAKQARASSDGSYYGVSTLVVTAPKTVGSTSTQTVLSMTTQREETVGDPGNTTIKYQSITITLVKSGTTWLVDGYTWKDGV